MESNKQQESEDVAEEAILVLGRTFSLARAVRRQILWKLFKALGESLNVIPKGSLKKRIETS